MKRVKWCIGITLITCIAIGFSNESEASVTLTSSLSATERYNDNIFFSDSAKERDLATFISPVVALTYDSKNITLAGRYVGTSELYSRHPDANRYDQTALFDLGLPFLSRKVKGVNVQITEGFTYTPELPAYYFDDQFQALANEGIQVQRTDTFRNSAGLRAEYAYSRRLNTTFSYNNLITRFKSKELQDSTVHTTDLKVEYQWFTVVRTTGTVSYDIGVTASDVAETITTHQLSIGAWHKMNQTLSVNGRVGVARVRNELNQLTATVEISKGYKSGGLSLRYSRDIGLARGLARSATLGQTAVGEATWGLARNTSAFVQLAYGQNVSLSGEELKTSSYQVGTGINALLLPWLSGNLNYTYFNQQATGVIRTNGERNLVMLTLTATIPPWRIVK